jgi:hypothetical protein
MRKNPTPDPDPADQPASTDAAAAGHPASAAEPAHAAAESASSTDDNTAPSLVWPPVEDELNDWEVLHLQSTGQTLIEPMKFTPPATPAPYVPPAPIDDPAGDTSLLADSTDFDLPETELIEPLPLEPTLQLPSPSGSRPAAAPGRPVAAPDDRTVVIARPAGLTPKPPAPMPPAPPVHAVPHQPAHDDTNPGTATRILVAPNFAA